MSEYQIGVFKKYVASHPIQLGFTHDGSSQANLSPDEVFEFDGQTLRFLDGRSWDKAQGLRGMISGGYVELWVPPKKSKKVKTQETKKPISQDEGYDELLADFEGSEESSDSSEISQDEYKAFLAWKASQGKKNLIEDDEEEIDMTSEDEVEEESEEDSEEEIVVSPSRRKQVFTRVDEEVTELRGGISLDRRQNTVQSGRDFGNKQARSLEGSAKAQVGSLVNPLSAGVQVGRQHSSDFPNKKGKEVIGFEKGATVNVVSEITLGAKTTSDLSSDFRDPKDVIKGPKGLPVVHVGEGAKQVKKASAARKKELEEEERLIILHEKKIAEIKKTHPKFNWDLRDTANNRFSQAWSYWQKGQTNKTAKKIFDLIMEVELPGLVDRLQQEIDYRLNGSSR